VTFNLALNLWKNPRRVLGNNPYIHASRSFPLCFIHSSYIPNQYDTSTPHYI